MPAMMTEAEAPDSFQLRTKNAVGGHYQSCMRRSLQSIVLYEADRCLGHRYSQLRPFQRKYALYSTAVDLLNTLDFLTDYHRHEIMFRTNASKEPLAPDLAWRRMKLITREITQTFVPKARKFMDDEENKDKSHDEICSMILQAMYEENTENSDKPYPPTWEFNHNNAFSVYRIYYRGTELDKNLPPPIPPRCVEVPVKKPSNKRQSPHGTEEVTLIPLFGSLGARGRIGGGAVLNDEERRAMLREVREHTELLREFEGVIPDEELAKRKRALYASMPPVPPPIAVAAAAKSKLVNSVTAALTKKKKVKVEEAAALPPQAPATPQAAPAGPEPAAPEPAAMEEDWENVKADQNEPTMASV